MNDLCSACGKPPHFGQGCKVGPNTEAETEALKKYAAKVEAKCGICMSPDHATPNCHKATSPLTVEQCQADTDAIKTTPMLDVSGLHPTMVELLQQCLAVQATKGHDYTSGSPDRLANFRKAAEAAGITMKQAWFVYFFKHLTAIETYVSYGQVESEPIRGRILDCINYLLLLELIREEETIGTEQKSSI